MEDCEYFTFRNRAIRIWLGLVFMVCWLVVIVFPTTAWVGTAGMYFFLIAFLVHRFRMFNASGWFNFISDLETPGLTWFEGWSGATGCVMMLVSVLHMLAQIWIGRIG